MRAALGVRKGGGDRANIGIGRERMEEGFRVGGELRELAKRQLVIELWVWKDGPNGLRSKDRKGCQGMSGDQVDGRP